MYRLGDLILLFPGPASLLFAGPLIAFAHPFLRDGAFAPCNGRVSVCADGRGAGLLGDVICCPDIELHLRTCADDAMAAYGNA